MIVIDTNVLSEMIRPRPSEAVHGWMASQPRERLFVTAMTEAEILFGIALLPHGRRRRALDEAARAMFEHDFAGRVLPFDRAAAAEFAAIVADRRRAGRPVGLLDAQIAAVARARGAALATRTVADFEGCGVAIVNPWRERAPP